MLCSSQPDKPNHLDVDGLTLALYGNIYQVMKEYIEGFDGILIKDLGKFGVEPKIVVEKIK